MNLINELNKTGLCWEIGTINRERRMPCCDDYSEYPTGEYFCQILGDHLGSGAAYSTANTVEKAIEKALECYDRRDSNLPH